MADLNGFDATHIEPSTGMRPLPTGDYLVIITASEMRATRNGLGKYLQLTFRVINGLHKNRRLWTRLNLTNAKAEAVLMARAELSSICRAVGVMAPRNSAELHNIPLVINVRQRTDRSGELRNVIRRYGRASQTQPVVRAVFDVAQYE